MSSQRSMGAWNPCKDYEQWERRKRRQERRRQRLTSPSSVETGESQHTPEKCTEMALCLLSPAMMGDMKRTIRGDDMSTAAVAYYLKSAAMTSDEHIRAVASLMRDPRLNNKEVAQRVKKILGELNVAKTVKFSVIEFILNTMDPSIADYIHGISKLSPSPAQDGWEEKFHLISEADIEKKPQIANKNLLSTFGCGQVARSSYGSEFTAHSTIPGSMYSSATSLATTIDVGSELKNHDGGRRTSADSEPIAEKKEEPAGGATKKVKDPQKGRKSTLETVKDESKRGSGISTGHSNSVADKSNRGSKTSPKKDETAATPRLSESKKRVGSPIKIKSTRVGRSRSKVSVGQDSKTDLEDQPTSPAQEQRKPSQPLDRVHAERESHSSYASSTKGKQSSQSSASQKSQKSNIHGSSGQTTGQSTPLKTYVDSEGNTRLVRSSSEFLVEIGTLSRMVPKAFLEDIVIESRRADSAVSHAMRLRAESDEVADAIGMMRSLAASIESENKSGTGYDSDSSSGSDGSVDSQGRRKRRKRSGDEDGVGGHRHGKHGKHGGHSGGHPKGHSGSGSSRDSESDLYDADGKRRFGPEASLDGTDSWTRMRMAKLGSLAESSDGRRSGQDDDQFDPNDPEGLRKRKKHGQDGHWLDCDHPSSTDINPGSGRRQGFMTVDLSSKNADMPDPHIALCQREEATRYYERKGIAQIFETLLTSLVLERPPQPLDHLIEMTRKMGKQYRARAEISRSLSEGSVETEHTCDQRGSSSSSVNTGPADSRSHLLSVFSLEGIEE